MEITRPAVDTVIDDARRRNLFAKKGRGEVPARNKMTRLMAPLIVALVTLVLWNKSGVGPQAAAEGKVVAILDGDTIEVMQGGKAQRIRLSEIDCPEKSQAYGARARQFTSSLVIGKQVKVLAHTRDRYGRTVAEIILPDGRSLNRELLKAGLAWWYRQYSKDRSYGALEREARNARRGLWADPNPVPPWAFRRGKGKR